MPDQTCSDRTGGMQVDKEIVYPPVTKVSYDTFAITKMQRSTLSPSHFSM